MHCGGSPRLFLLQESRIFHSLDLNSVHFLHGNPNTQFFSNREPFGFVYIWKIIFIRSGNVMKKKLLNRCMIVILKYPLHVTCINTTVYRKGIVFKIV